jgi:hypothetical protein
VARTNGAKIGSFSCPRGAPGWSRVPPKSTYPARRFNKGSGDRRRIRLEKRCNKRLETRARASKTGGRRDALSVGDAKTLASLPSPESLRSHFVCPNSEKDRLEKTTVPRPLSEFYLADNQRFDPMATFHHIEPALLAVLLAFVSAKLAITLYLYVMIPMLFFVPSRQERQTMKRHP